MIIQENVAIRDSNSTVITFMFCVAYRLKHSLPFYCRYNWEIDKFSQYLSIQRICRFVGLFAILPFLSHILKVKDSLIAAVGTVLTIFAYFIIAVGQKDWTGPNNDWDPGWVMYLSAVFQLNSVITVTIRSQSTKEVDKDEIGRIFSVVAFGQALVPLAAHPIFGSIYKATINSFPGAYLLTVDGLLLFVLGSSVYMFCDGRRSNDRDNDGNNSILQVDSSMEDDNGHS